jgi:hypothetical protein
MNLGFASRGRAVRAPVAESAKNLGLLPPTFALKI